LERPLALGTDQDLQQIGGETHGTYPRCLSDASRRRHLGSTFTCSSRNTCAPSRASTLARAAWPSALMVRPPSPITMPFWLARSTAETTTVLEDGGGWWRLVEAETRSAFVYTVTTGARGGFSSRATDSSGGAGYSARGCRYAMTSASAIARSAAARITTCNWYSGSSKPGESVKMYCVSSRVSRPTTGRRVDCGLGETMARW